MKRETKTINKGKSVTKSVRRKIKNISKPKDIEQLLPFSFQQWENTFDAINDAVCVLDAEGRILNCNKAMTKLTVKSSGELIGQHCYEIMHGTTKPIKDCPVLRMRKTLSREITELKIGERYFNVIADPCLDESGRLISAVHIVTDITRRKCAEEELQQSFENLQKTLEGTILAMVKIVETKDPYTAGHQQRVAKLSCATAKEMGLSGQQINVMRMASLIHDVGKIYIPAEILGRPGPLSEIELQLIKTHPQVGHDILKTVEFLSPVVTIVLQHHERMNGSGYPQGLSSEDIILEAKILGVVDVIEAMSSHRPYRAACGIDKALEEISKNKGILYDTQVVDVCLKLFYDKGFKFE